MKDEDVTLHVKRSTRTTLKRYKRKLRKKNMDDVIGVLQTGYEKSLTKVEIEKPILTQHGDLAESVPCLSRFDFEDMYYCGKNAPKIVALVTLKICNACRFRITKEGLAELKEREKVKTTYYLQCGAMEKIGLDGSLLVKSDKCPTRFLRGRWHGISSCRVDNCTLIKSVVGVVKK